MALAWALGFGLTWLDLGFDLGFELGLALGQTWLGLDLALCAKRPTKPKLPICFGFGLT